MKKVIASIVGGLCAFALAGSAEAVPMDLSGFSVIENQPGSVTESSEVVSFTESMEDAALYFYNDSYAVDPSATTLSFDYDFTLGENDYDDYLLFSIDYVGVWLVDVTGSGTLTFDLTSYQGTTISIDWGLIWGGDWDATTTAQIYNIDLATASSGTEPVPEPATMLLFGTGLAGVYGANRKRKFLSSSK